MSVEVRTVSNKMRRIRGNRMASLEEYFFDGNTPFAADFGSIPQ